MTSTLMTWVERGKSNTKIGRDVNHNAVLEVATRLQTEGLARLDIDADGALVALRQAFSLERQFGDDGERLCRACAALCRGLARAAAPSPPAEAVTVLLQALDTIEERSKAYQRNSTSAAAAARGVDEAAGEFLARELLGLAKRLGGVAGSRPSSPTSKPSSPSTPTGASSSFAAAMAPVPRLDELRAADRAFERLVALAAIAPLPMGGANDLVITQQELLYQLAQQAKAIGLSLMASRTVRDTEAATFYFTRGMRKLRLAAIADRDPSAVEMRQLMSDSEAQIEALRNPPPPESDDVQESRAALMSADHAGRGLAVAAAGATSDEYCIIS